ncbi:MAG: dTDP-4-dehydrorhamnose 3,5-epimerase family protein [Thermodesulfobacteriota bacterium]
MFKDGAINGVEIRPFKKKVDERGWLMELFRQDELSVEIFPVMSYISMTKPGIIRGPHEHKNQTDLFCFIGPSNFKIVLWDNRETSPTYRNKTILLAGEDNPSTVIVPEGVVHAYKNVGDKDGIAINCPNSLFMGQGKKAPVDEIRYENNMNSPFKIEHL